MTAASFFKLFSYLLLRLRKSLIDQLLQCGSVILFINTAHNRFPNDVALTIHNAGSGEGHNAEGKLTGITGRVKIDVAECSPGLFPGKP